MDFIDFTSLFRCELTDDQLIPRYVYDTVNEKFCVHQEST